MAYAPPQGHTTPIILSYFLLTINNVYKSATTMITLLHYLAPWLTYFLFKNFEDNFSYRKETNHIKYTHVTPYRHAQGVQNVNQNTKLLAKNKIFEEKKRSKHVQDTPPGRAVAHKESKVLGFTPKEKEHIYTRNYPKKLGVHDFCEPLRQRPLSEIQTFTKDLPQL